MAFATGDHVKLVGTVKQSVTDTPTGRVSVLIGTIDAPGNPSHEYWVNEQHLVADVATVAAEPAAAAPAAESTTTGKKAHSGGA